MPNTYCIGKNDKVLQFLQEIARLATLSMRTSETLYIPNALLDLDLWHVEHSSTVVMLVFILTSVD